MADLQDVASSSGPVSRALHAGLVVDDSTWLFAEWNAHSILTTDAGKSWHAAELGAFVYRFVKDATQRIWGLYYWRGIHERSSAAVVFADDPRGQWRRINFDTDVCFPIDIALDMEGVPILLASDGQIWRLDETARSVAMHWTPIGTRPPLRKSRQLIGGSHNWIVSAYDGGGEGKTHLWVSKDRARTWDPRPGEAFEVLCMSSTGRLVGFRNGKLEESDGNAASWVVIGVVPGVQRAFALAQRGRDVFLAGEEEYGKALGIFIDGSGRVVRPSGLGVGQAYYVGATPSGTVIIATGDGLFKLDEAGARWARVWPE